MKFWLCLSLFLATSVDIAAGTQMTIHVCQNEELNFKCDAGHKITIVTVNYGRLDNSCPGGTVPAKCDDGWTLYDGDKDGHKQCYKMEGHDVEADRREMEDAKKHCAASGAELPTVTNERISKFFSDRLVEKNMTMQSWLNAMKVGDDFVWQDSARTPWNKDFEPWAPDYPRSGLCLTMRVTKEGILEWRDMDCNWNFIFECRKDPQSTELICKDSESTGFVKARCEAKPDCKVPFADWTNLTSTCPEGTEAYLSVTYSCDGDKYPHTTPGTNGTSAGPQPTLPPKGSCPANTWSVPLALLCVLNALLWSDCLALMRG